MAAANGQIILMEEVDLSAVQFEEKEICDFAETLGIDVELEDDLLWIAEKALRDPLPKDWVPAEAVGEGIFYFNKVTRESTWEHPLDEFYRQFVMEAREKRICMPLTMQPEMNDDELSVKLINLAGKVLASIPVTEPEATSFKDFKDGALAQLNLPADVVPRFVTMSGSIMTRSSSSLLLNEVFAKP